ncbi:helix-turn-helix transcriptional regulator [Capnocytophaga gingivalis]|jgi:hypothetical protein
MATNKNAQLRYKILDECFSNRYKTFGIQDLIEVCSDRLSEYYGEEIRISRRTIYEDIRFMESADGFDAPIARIKEGKNVYFRYEDPHFSILKKELSVPEKEVITNALSIFARIKKLQGFEGIEELATKIQAVLDIDYQEQIIDFQDNEYLKGTEYLNELYHYILNQQSIKLFYKPFTEEVKEIPLSPYYLKQYNNRWFLLGYNATADRLETFALDRIQKLQADKHSYQENTIDFEEYFEDIIGITNFADREVQTVELALSPEIIPYIATKPLHSSQRLRDNKVSLKVKLNYELETLVLSFGEKITVLSPVELRERIQKRLQNALNQYDTTK